MDDRRNQHLVDTHNHPELAEEVSPEERESSEEDNHELIDKNPDGKDRDYSFKKDIDGEQVIRIDDERSEERRVGKEVEISMMGGRMGESRKQSTSDIEKAGAHKCRDT